MPSKKSNIRARTIDGLTVAGTQKKADHSKATTARRATATTRKTTKTSRPASKSAKKVLIQDEINIREELRRIEAADAADATKHESIPKDVALESTVEEDIENIIDKPVKKSPGKKSHAKKSSKLSIAIRAILIFAQLVSSCVLAGFVIRTNLLQGWQNILLCVVLAALQTLTTFKLVRKKTRKAPRVLFGILSAILSIIYILGSVYLGKTIGFIENITTVLDYETQEYSVLVLKDSKYGEITDLKSKTIGFQKNNPNLTLAEEELQKAVSFDTKEDDLATLTLALSDNGIEAISIASTYLEVLKDNQEDFYNSVKVIYTYEIRYQKDTTASDTDITSEPFIIYISGSDSRGKISNADRSDVNMLAVVNPKTHKILLVSVPRDYYVQLHGTTGTKDKLTHAGIYGIDMSKNTMADLFGVEIAHTAKVGFTGVENIVDALNGVDINSDTKFSAWTDRSCVYNVGPMHLDGRCALAYARERHAYASGDRHRVQNQQEVLSAIIKKATSAQYLVRYTDILASLEGSFTTSLSYNDITNFAKAQLNSMQGWNIESISVDGTGAMLPTYSMGSQPLYVMIPDQSTVDTAKAKIAEVMGEE